MKSRRTIVAVEGFYADPKAVRKYALLQDYYTPYEDQILVQKGRQRATWWASRFRSFDQCPFKSSKTLIGALQDAVGENIDMDHWRGVYPVDKASKPIVSANVSTPTCLWNCSFHVKPENGQQLGDGVHNHVIDSWNSVGPDGWAGIIYLNPGAPLYGGLHLWRNIDSSKNFDWMTQARDWELIDSFGNIFNRLVLVRGDIPHSGAGGWGECIENGRMYQTFFFRTNKRRNIWPVSLSVLGI
jgi:hypothetical protein